MNETQTKRSANAFALSNVMAGLEGTIVATALPAIVSSLHGITEMSWVITAFMLMMAISAPIWTKLAERFGYKQVFITGTLVFIISSLLSGLSLSMPMLIVAHGVMGIGSGAMQQLPFVIYGLMFEPTRRRVAVGNAVSAYSIAAIVGPIIGGIIVDSLGWRWVFFINIPIGMFMIWLIARNFKLESPVNRKSIDYLGSTLLSLATITLMLALQFLGQANSNAFEIITLILVSLVLYLLFIVAEHRAKDPIIPLTLLHNRSLMMKNGVMFLQYGFFNFYNNYLPTWGQGVFGKTALIGGMILIPGAIALAISSRLSNRLLQFFSERLAVTLGMLLMLLGDLLLVVLPFNTNFIWLPVAAAIIGLSFGMVNVTLQVAVQESVSPEHIGAATALNSLIRTLGSTLVLSALSVSLNQSFTSGIAHHSGLTITLLTRISDSTALHLIPSALIEPLRQVLYGGLHNLAIISLFILAFAVLLNWIDPWIKSKV